MDYIPIYNTLWERKKSRLPNPIPFILSVIVFLAIIILLVVGKAKAEITPLSVAQSQIGLGETTGNNRGMYIRQYLNGQEGLPWCAGFISYCFKKSGIKARYTLRAKDYLKIGKIIDNPRPGDLIILSRDGGGHIGIIEKVTQDEIMTIEGNVGMFPSTVKRVTYNRNNIKNLLGFVRLVKCQ